jgi:organic hydroperoxide reductase OsmC/OhrA
MTETFVSHLEWSGAAKGPTRDPATFSRDLDLSIDGIVLPMSSAPGFRGNPLRANPEQLYVAALSACHALTFLFLAARSRVTVTGYTDDAVGELSKVDGKLRMAAVTLRPRITLEAGPDVEQVRALVEQAHADCFIGNSVTARVEVEPQFEFATPAALAS